ncbi:MAG TPA: UvrD-helicase domain-containing protein [Thermoguttaceae bacterium]|nr:UvrD-helicase domain-containing protein [Thermoguttaceae bacterium]
MAAGDRPGLTEQQRRAVFAWDVSVALSAGAGCGKTFVLTERFLAQLQPVARAEAGRTALGQIVAITFTERAAREMRDRIRAACSRRLIEAPEQQVAYWLDLIRELDTARISTIHSFCGSLLRAHAVEARLDPQFRVLDQAQADTLLYELLDREIRDRLAERDEAVIQLMVRFGLERLYDMIRVLLDRRGEIDWPQWREETVDELIERWKDFWRSDTLPRVLAQVAESSAARTVLEIARRHGPDHATMRQRCDVLVEQLPDLPRSDDPAAALDSILQSAKVQGGGGKKVWESEEIYEKFRDAATKLRGVIKDRQRFLSFDAEAARPAAEAALWLVAVADGVAKAYEDEKQDQSVLDFNDLLIRARELLAGPDREALRKRLASRIRLLLVDEFQDTDPLQVELVEALCGDGLRTGKLFFVGDYKQSIYRFRGADPHVFRRLRNSIPEEGRLPLSLNFRSQPAVIDFVNALFGEEMGPEYEPLRPHRQQVSPTPAVEFLWAPDGEEEGGTERQAERLRRREADWIARRIRAMLDSGERIVWDQEAAAAGEPAARAVRPGDVALLFRALSNVEYYEEALRRYGIDYYLVGGHAFYAQQEIFDLLNLLRALDSPCDEVSLAGALRSPLFGLLDETLFWLAQHPKGLFAGLHAADLPAELDPHQRRRVEFAAATLGELRAVKDRLPIAQLINEALRRTGYDAILLSEFLGERKLANLRKLIEQARSFDRSGIFTLADFITQLSQFVARQPDEALAATQPEATDVVRLMTIHQSKGLEFPVVVVPDVDRRAMGRTSAAAFTRELGPMVKDSEAIGGFDLHALAEGDDDRAERTRLLYVATTRTADYLILSAGVTQLGAVRGPWMELLARRFADAMWGEGNGQTVLGRSDSGDEASPRVEVRVTTTPPPVETKPPGLSRRRNLAKVIEKARKMAEGGSGRSPRYLAAVGPDPSARRQYSFSRLTGVLHARENSGRVDLPVDDAQRPPLDPCGLGTLVHAVLAEIDFRRPGDVAALVERHAPRHLPDAEDLREPIEMIRRFLDSPRAEDLAQAKEVHCELEFLLAWPPDGKGPKERYLQGFIDCLYLDAADRWHVLDYKTNRVTESTLEATATEYEMQMLLYALAVQRILGRPADELALCFLRPGLEHSLPWNDAAQGRVIEMIDSSIHKAATGGRAP